MGTSNFYNHDNGIFLIPQTDFDQMKEWMETDEFFEWAREDGEPISNEMVWDELNMQLEEDARNWLENFKYYLEDELKSGYSILMKNNYEGQVYNKGGKLVASLELRSGYYDGCQVIVETDPHELFNGYYYFETQAELLEEYTPNHKRLLKYVANYTESIVRVGGFSDGTSLYQKV